MANNQNVRRHLDAFTRGRIIGKLEEGLCVTSVATEFELLTASFHDFGDNFKLQEQLFGGFSSDRPRGTTSADDRYIVLQARRKKAADSGRNR
ncbi:transposable element Tcb1 transposase [Trichonephila clavipes]|nr:transposable element Tcb1 transposase [Trichonephila clavipes]